jgi:hypothetical protein
MHTSAWWQRGAGRAAAAALALSVGGCAVRAPQRPDPGRVAPSGRAARESEQNLRWSNHGYTELLGTLGLPQLLLEIPAGGNPPGFIAVYPRDAASGCLDTYVMVYGPSILVRGYQCR